MARTCAMATVTRVLAELTVATAISIGVESCINPRPAARARAEARARDETETETVVRVSVEREAATLYFVCWRPSSRGRVDDGWGVGRGDGGGDATEDSPVAARRLDASGRRRGRGVGRVVRHPHRRGDFGFS